MPKSNRAQFERFAKNVFGAATAKLGIAALEQWFDNIDIPTRLSQLGIKADDLPAIVENAQANTRAFGIADVYTQAPVLAILKGAL